jgi:adenylate kinase family enzyme
MNAVQISGMSGAGKTTIAAVLARRGLAVIDADGDPLLARHVDSAGNVVGDPAVPDFAWLARHSWAWNPARLDELIDAAAPATLYVCGCADNELELADRFTQVFLLEIDEPTMLGRLASRDKEWGRIGDTREYQRRKLPEYQGRLRASGAIPIDARRPLDQVVDAILTHPLGRSAASRARKPGNPGGLRGLARSRWCAPRGAGT